MTDFPTIFGSPEEVSEYELNEFFKLRIKPSVDFMFGGSFAESNVGDKIMFFIGKGALKLTVEAVCYLDEELDDENNPIGKVVVREVCIFACVEKSAQMTESARAKFVDIHSNEYDFDIDLLDEQTGLAESRLWETVKMVFDYDEDEFMACERSTCLQNDDEEELLADEDSRSERERTLVYSDEFPTVEGTVVFLAGHFTKATS